MNEFPDCRRRISSLAIFKIIFKNMFSLWKWIIERLERNEPGNRKAVWLKLLHGEHLKKIPRQMDFKRRFDTRVTSGVRDTMSQRSRDHFGRKSESMSFEAASPSCLGFSSFIAQFPAGLMSPQSIDLFAVVVRWRLSAHYSCSCAPLLSMKL